MSYALVGRRRVASVDAAVGTAAQVSVASLHECRVVSTREDALQIPRALRAAADGVAFAYAPAGHRILAGRSSTWSDRDCTPLASRFNACDLRVELPNTTVSGFVTRAVEGREAIVSSTFASRVDSVVASGRGLGQLRGG